MRIQSTDVFAGQPILKIRKLLRRTEAYQFGFSVADIAELLEIDIPKSQKIVQELHAGGYIEPFNDKAEGKWQNTIRGNALAYATARKPITRKTAERLVAEFLNRVQEVNNCNDYAYQVKQVIIFGSYLSESKTLGDIDLAVFLEQRYTNPDKQKEVAEKRTDYALSKGKGSIDAILWPHLEIYQILKGHSPSISIHDGQTTQPLFETEPSKILYDATLNEKS